MKATRMLIALKFLWVVTTACGQNGESPYFQVTSPSAKGTFPLLSTSADVHITGPIADVRIIQKYRNDGSDPLEAVYVFPASTRAAVYQMEMHIGSRVIVADIMEREKATRTYEAAKQEGKRASLLEEARPNVFQMQVANIMPGETVEVHLYYTEFIIPESQEYSFVYPTVVGPRYNDGTGVSPNAEFVSMPYTHHGQPPSYSFDLQVALQMPVPIRRIRCATHQIRVTRTAPQTADVSLDSSASDGGNRDFILTYSLSGDQIASGVLTYAMGDEKYFLCQIEPPKLDAQTLIVPREYIFIVDVSGSMNGFPLEVSKALMRHLLDQLRPTDKFNILFFAGASQMLSPSSIAATKANVTSAFDHMENMQAGGGTELLPALKAAMAVPKQTGYSRSFVIVTDGYVSVEEEALHMVRQSLDQANFFAFGIGSSVNRYLIEGLAHVGRGEPFIVTDQSEAKGVADKFESYIQHPVLTDIRVEAQGATLYDLIPEKIPDLMAARPIYFFGKYNNCAHASITVTGRQGSIPFTSTVAMPASTLDHAALRYLWAREKIRYLDDFNAVNTSEDRIREVTQLGLDYHLMTKYTSFVAVDSEVVNQNGITRRVKQPLPMPQGVSDYAVGFEMELPEMVTGLKSKTETSKIQRLNVDITCTDPDLKLLTESVLEIAMQKLSGSECMELIGTTVSLSVDTKGNISFVSGDKKLSEFVMQALQKVFRSLNMPALKTSREIRVTIKSEVR